MMMNAGATKMITPNTAIVASAAVEIVEAVLVNAFAESPSLSFLPFPELLFEAMLGTDGRFDVDVGLPLSVGMYALVEPLDVGMYAVVDMLLVFGMSLEEQEGARGMGRMDG